MRGLALCVFSIFCSMTTRFEILIFNEVELQGYGLKKVCLFIIKPITCIHMIISCRKTDVCTLSNATKIVLQRSGRTE